MGRRDLFKTSGRPAGTVILTLNINFTGAFAGNRIVYAAARDTADGNNTDWQAMATRSVQ